MKREGMANAAQLIARWLYEAGVRHAFGIPGGEVLSLIEMKQRSMGLANAGVDFPATDYAAVARALGGDGYACGDREQLAQALAAALKAERFSVIACEFSRSAYDGRI